MKKLFSALLILAILLTLAACGKSQPAATTAAPSSAPAEEAPLPPLQVGYGKVCITPKSKVALSSSDQETYTAVYEDVYTTCIAITDKDNNTVLMFTTDISYTKAGDQKTFLQAASDATGVPMSNISYSVTHNHSGLEPSGTVHSLLKKSLAEAAVLAMEDRAPATLEIGACYPEGFNFVRHYTTEDGHWVGDNYYSPTGSKAANKMEEADNEMQLMHFVREGKQNVLLLNWQAHGTYTYKMEYLCTDYVGSLRDEVEAKTGTLVAYFQGAAGNLNPWSSLGDNKFEHSLEGVTAFGTALAQYPIQAMDSLTPVDATGISLVETTQTIQVRRDSNEVILAAGAYRQVRQSGGSHAEAIQAAGGLIHGDQGEEYVANRARNAGSQDITLRVVRLGSVAFVIAPYEMFSQSGQYIKAHSPFEMTFILGYTNGRNGYIPTADCIEHGCYEFEGSLYEAGTAETLAEAYLTLLNELQN
jgi:predicted small lipoprotein YifL